MKKNTSSNLNSQKFKHFNISNSETVLLSDIQLRHGSYRVHKVEQINNLTKNNKIINETPILNNFVKTNNLADKRFEKDVANTNCHKSCLFCGQMNHTWQDCDIRLAQLQARIGHNQKASGITVSVDNVRARVIQEKTESEQISEIPMDLTYLNSRVPPTALTIMPRGDNDLMILAFGAEKPLKKEHFFWLREENKYRRESNLVFTNTITSEHQYFNNYLSSQPSPPQPLHLHVDGLNSKNQLMKLKSRPYHFQQLFDALRKTTRLRFLDRVTTSFAETNNLYSKHIKSFLKHNTKYGRIDKLSSTSIFYKYEIENTVGNLNRRSNSRWIGK